MNTLLLILLSAAIVTHAAVESRDVGQPPQLGFAGTLVELDSRVGVPSPDGVPNRGIRVDRVTPGTAAARLGLERGDIVISIDSMRFTTLRGYRHALQCAGQRPSLIIIDVRTGRFIRRAVDLPHRELPLDEAVPQLPDTYWMSIDLVEDMR